MSALKKTYETQIRPQMQKEGGYSTPMAAPRIEKIVLNMGVGRATQDKKFIDSAVEELTLIAGQRAVKTKSKKSISNFKLREGYEIGCKATLRGERMYDFLERLIYIALPRVRDFQGVARNAFDGRGNYNLGVKEHIIFPEIRYDKIDSVKGLNITICTTAKTNDEARDLLTRVGMPFRKR